ncbi:hypothetical protein FQN60_006428 [Etheostoma spectabile]|uniref:Uncharacterized protein n=1 Tax=Etheostoma spectabile TaxID=54343 RepID=A0A5J5CM16_9PERO|nr:hypothetical protein FQN60_006428 [Etheostoma spectabile]
MFFCELLNDLKNPVLFHLHEGWRGSQSLRMNSLQDESSGTRCLREGRLRLNVSLRGEDQDCTWCMCSQIRRSSCRCWLQCLW